METVMLQETQSKKIVRRGEIEGIGVEVEYETTGESAPPRVMVRMTHDAKLSSAEYRGVPSFVSFSLAMSGGSLDLAKTLVDIATSQIQAVLAEYEQKNEEK